MEIHIEYWVWAFATLLACYFCLNNFVWRLNEWYYNMKVRKKQYPLPPGHLGWPLIGNMLAFVKDFKSGHPDSFINNLISRSLLFLPLQNFFKQRHTHMHTHMHKHSRTFIISIQLL
jgi:hypothetical protein